MKKSNLEKRYTIQTMEMYAEIVRLIGGQAETIQDDKFYWSVKMDDSDSIQIELSEISDETELAINEVLDSIASSPIRSYDIIKTIVGAAVMQGINVKY